LELVAPLVALERQHIFEGADIAPMVTIRQFEELETLVLFQIILSLQGQLN